MMMRHRCLRPRRLLVLLLGAAMLAYAGVGAYRAWRWNAWPWLPAYWLGQLDMRASAPQHVILVVADHYEPGFDAAEALRRNEEWLARFEPVARAARDSYGNPFRYTWFYPFDQPHDAVIERLNRSVAAGLGEIELHWHHPDLDNDSFDAELGRAVAWFNGHGALIGADGRPAFAFVHGNWALDASSRHCRVTREISILQRHGGYMDMTFSTIGTESQPRSMLNAIYYVDDDDAPRSYERGDPVRVGTAVRDRFMLFEGPIALGLDLRLEFGALERYALPSAARIERWLDAGIHVRGRPGWVFVKLYSHGIQSPQIVESHLEGMLAQLRREVEARGARLHFMTAREAFNVVKAAESGATADPESLRDFLVPPPRNSGAPRPGLRAAARAVRG